MIDVLKKLGRSYIIIVVLICFVFVWVTYTNYHNKSIEAFKDSYEIGNVFVDQALVGIEQYLQEQIDIAQVIATDKRIVAVCKNPEEESLRKDALEFVENIHRIYPEYMNLPIVVFNDNEFDFKFYDKKYTFKSGRIIVDTVKGKTANIDATKLSFVKAIMDGEPYYISEVYPSVANGTPIFVVSVPVFDEQGLLVGVAMVSPRLDYFTKEYIESFSYAKTGYLVGIDGRGVLIAHKNKEFLLKEAQDISAEAKESADKILAGANIFVNDFEGDQKIYVSRKVEFTINHSETTWYIFYTQTVDEIVAHLEQYLFILIAINLLVLFIVLLLIYIIFNKYRKDIEKEKLVELNQSLEEKVAERTLQLEKMATIDSLTGLYNRNNTITLMENELELITNQSNKKIVLVMMDIDFFKTVNDSYGHVVGDEVLRIIAKLIRSVLSEDTIFGRYGGEEFVFMKVSSDRNILDNTLLQMEQLRKAIEGKVIDIEGLDHIRITASFGVSQWSEEPLDLLIKKADDYLYKAKENGRNQIVYK